MVGNSHRLCTGSCAILTLAYNSCRMGFRDDGPLELSAEVLCKSSTRSSQAPCKQPREGIHKVFSCNLSGIYSRVRFGDQGASRTLV